MADETQRTAGPGDGTRAVHGGERDRRLHDALATPIFQTATYTFRDTQELLDFKEGRRESCEYGRYGNPTTRAAELKIAGLDGTQDACLFASGMCAITTALLAILPKGGHIVTTSDCYRRTRQFCETVLPKLGVTTAVVDPSDLPGLQAALNDRTRVFFTECPTNPYLRCPSLEEAAGICRARRVQTLVDNTFATPINQRPFALGADLVVHSGTKYLGGHNDLLAGAVSGRAPLVSAVRDVLGILGGVVDPHTSYLLLRGMKTLHLRVEAQNASAQEIAEFLESHPKVARVWYPGLKSHPDHAVAVRQMKGFGGVVSFELKADLKAAARFIDRVKIPYIAPSLGGVESLIEQPTIMSYWDLTPADRARIGIPDSLVRLSVGVEDPEDLIADLRQALEGVGAP